MCVCVCLSTSCVCVCITVCVGVNVCTVEVEVKGYKVIFTSTDLCEKKCLLKVYVVSIIWNSDFGE